MARAWISWREDDFLGAEREFRSSAEFCSENAICSVWRLNAGHVLFMQDKYKEAAAFYEPIVRQHSDDVGGDTLNSECSLFTLSFLLSIFICRSCLYRLPCWPTYASPTL